MEKKKADVQVQVTFPLGVKLAIIIGTIVLVSLGCVTFLNSHFIGQDVQITAENNNLTINSRSAGTVEDKISTIRSNVFQLLDLLNVVGGGRAASLALSSFSVTGDNRIRTDDPLMIQQRGFSGHLLRMPDIY